MNKEKYQKHLNSKCNGLTKKEKDKIFSNDTISSLLLIASIVVLAGYCWLNYAVIKTEWIKCLFLVFTCVFFALAIFLVFWRFARKDEYRVKARMKFSAKIDVKTPANKILNNLSDKEKAYYKKQSLRSCNAFTIFYIILYLVIATIMFIFMFNVNAFQNVNFVHSAPVVTFFMYTGICALIFGMLTTPLLMLKHNMLPEEDQIKLYIARNPKIFKSKLK